MQGLVSKSLSTAEGHAHCSRNRLSRAASTEAVDWRFDQSVLADCQKLPPLEDFQPFAARLQLACYPGKRGGDAPPHS